MTSSYDSGVLLWLLMILLCSMLWFLCATSSVLDPTTKPLMDRPQEYWWTDMTSWDLNLHVGSPHCFKPSADGPLAYPHAVTSAVADRSLCSSAGVPQLWFLGPRGDKMLPPYDICISAGHLYFGKSVVFKAGSWLKMSVIKAGTNCNFEQDKTVISWCWILSWSFILRCQFLPELVHTLNCFFRRNQLLTFQHFFRCMLCILYLHTISQKALGRRARETGGEVCTR